MRVRVLPFLMLLLLSCSNDDSNDSGNSDNSNNNNEQESSSLIPLSIYERVYGTTSDIYIEGCLLYTSDAADE